MQIGFIDYVSLLAETDIKNKENIVKRKSMYSQLQSQIQQLSEAMKDKEGTIETLQRQLVQAGIKGKVMQAEMEISKKKEQVKGTINKASVETEAKQHLLQNVMANNANLVQARQQDMLQNEKNNLENSQEED